MADERSRIGDFGEITLYRFNELKPGSTLRITTSDGPSIDVSVRGAGRAWLDCTLTATGEDVVLVCVPRPFDDEYKQLVAQGGIMDHATALIEHGVTATILTSHGNYAFSVASVELV